MEIDIENILNDAFKNEVKIIKSIQSGFRCKTYLVEENSEKYILQIYQGDTKYQAKKKYDLLKQLDYRGIPKAYKYKNFDQYSYLITEYIEGETLTEILKREEYSFSNIVDDFTKILIKIHKKKSNTFGWITDNSVIENENFVTYIKTEYNRLIHDLDNIDEKILNKIKVKIENAIKIIDSRTKNMTISVLCWYDINPDNILIKKENKEYKISGLIDPGGARYGLKEWDLAFIKMETLKSKEEYDLLIKYYEKNSKEKVDTVLVDALSVIVELNDISFMIVDKVRLPIPFESNFKEEINSVLG